VPSGAPRRRRSLRSRRMTTDPLEIGAGTLGVTAVVRAARGRPFEAVLAADARDRIARGHAAYHAAIAGGRVYGATTGVGANRTAVVTGGDTATLAARILRSHAGSAGWPLPDEACRATMLIRAEQLAAGRSGVTPASVDALVAAVADGSVPELATGDAIGTGDLTSLAQLALVLAGERPWRSGGAAVPTVSIDAVGGLAFISSNAETLARTCLALDAVRGLLRASLAVAALSHAGVRGSAEPFAAAHLARPGVAADARIAAAMAELVGDAVGARIQDSYGFRAFVPVTAPAAEALDRLEASVEVELHAGTENPLVDADSDRVLHHGGFDQMRLALDLDTVRLALTGVGALSAARLAALVDPAQTGRAAFLADDEAGSSGVMILEYAAAAALADLRHAAQPATLHSTVISRGLEDHASFASHAATRLQAAGAALERLLAVELVSAVRAGRPPAGTARRHYDAAREALPAGLAERPLDADVGIARALLAAFATDPGPPL
jgi:histidine ammonia-lyase